MYLIEDNLLYVKEQCAQDDVDATFFLHLDPVDVDDLPAHRKRYGFDNLDFRRHRLSELIEGGVCAARRELPDYDIAAIRTGQFAFVEGGFNRLWEGETDIAGQAGGREDAP